MYELWLQFSGNVLAYSKDKALSLIPNAEKKKKGQGGAEERRGGQERRERD